MKPSRFQPLNRVYKDLITLLYDAALHLYRTDFVKPESEDALQKTRDVLSLFEYQTAVEEAVLFGAIHDYEPIVVTILRDDHRERRKHIRLLQNLITINQNKTEPYQHVLFSGRLLHRFNEFMACCIEQMKSHEAMMNPVLWRYYSDKELKQISVSLTVRQVLSDNKKTITSSKKPKHNLVIQ